jgi:hypothetical protein
MASVPYAQQNPYGLQNPYQPGMTYAESTELNLELERQRAVEVNKQFRKRAHLYSESVCLGSSQRWEPNNADMGSMFAVKTTIPWSVVNGDYSVIIEALIHRRSDSKVFPFPVSIDKCDECDFSTSTTYSKTESIKENWAGAECRIQWDTSIDRADHDPTQGPAMASLSTKFEMITYRDGDCQGLSENEVLMFLQNGAMWT